VGYSSPGEYLLPIHGESEQTHKECRIMAQYAKEIVDAVLTFKAQKRSAKQTVERMGKKGMTVTEADVKAILEAAKPSVVNGRETPKPATVGVGGGILGDFVEPATAKTMIAAEAVVNAKKAPVTKTPVVLTNREATLRALVKAGKGVTAVAVASKSNVPARVVELELGALEKDGLVAKGKVSGYFVATPEGAAEVAKYPGNAVNPPKPVKRVAPKPEPSPAQTVANKMKEEGLNGGVTDATMEEAEKVTATKKAPAPKKEKKAVIRPEWNGMGMCAFLRYVGAAFKEAPKEAVTAVAVKVGFDPDPTTVKIQSRKGRNGDNVPAPDGKVAKEVAAMMKAALKELPKE
jgi:hypothetical protein